MPKVYLALVAFLALQETLAKPNPEFEQTEPSLLAELANNTRALLPDSKKISKVMNTNIQTLANHTHNAMVELNSQVRTRQFQIDDSIKQLVRKFNETVTNLENVADEAKVKELKNNLDDGFNKIVEAVKSNMTKAKNCVEERMSDIQDVAEKFLDQVGKIKNNLLHQIKVTVEEAKIKNQK